MDGDADLVAAAADLAEVARELEKVGENPEMAEHNVAKVIEDVERPHQFSVTVLYNGVAKKFEVRREELVRRLLDEALKAFGPINNPHLLALFTNAGVELNDSQTIEAAGVKPHDELLLRPSTVRGGWC
jgi:hypothetical protein